MGLRCFPGSRVAGAFCCQNEVKLMTTGVDNDQVID